MVVVALSEALAGRGEAALEAAQRAVRVHPASELAARTLERLSRPPARARP